MTGDMRSKNGGMWFNDDCSAEEQCRLQGNEVGKPLLRYGFLHQGVN